MTTRERLAEAIRRHAEGAGFEHGRVYRVEVRHDDDCPFWDGHDCDCDVEVLSRSRKGGEG